jgi:DNA-binding NarL/FixJ family response regulator
VSKSYGDALSPAEERVARLVACGLTNDQIAARLGLSERTVRSCISDIISKTYVGNRVQVMLYALRSGLVSLEEASAWLPGR